MQLHALAVARQPRAHDQPRAHEMSVVVTSVVEEDVDHPHRGVGREDGHQQDNCAYARAVRTSTICVLPVSRLMAPWMFIRSRPRPLPCRGGGNAHIAATLTNAPPLRAEVRMASSTCMLARPSAKVAAGTGEAGCSPRIAAFIDLHSSV